MTLQRQYRATGGATQQEIDKQLLLLKAAADGLIQKTDENAVYDGTYTIGGALRHATADQDSMGNAALVKPMHLTVKDKAATLRIELNPLTADLGHSTFTGYLAALNYFPDWKGGSTGYAAPTGETPVAVDVESYYEGVYDPYNDPKKGVDENVKGKLYPHFVTMPVTIGDGEIWVQVYVPVMESLSKGSGSQYAKLRLDWNSLKQLTGTDTNKEALNTMLQNAEKLLAGLKPGAVGNSRENALMLTDAIANAKAVGGNLNVDQKAVDATAKSLKAALNVFSSEPVETDKTELKKAISAADSYLNDKDITYTDATRGTLQTVRDAAQKVFANAQATQTQVDFQVTAINNAIDGLSIDGTDKRELKKAAANIRTYLQDTKSYTAASLEMLKSLYDRASAVYKNGRSTQEDVDAQVRILNYAVENLKKAAETAVDKSGLHDMMLAASGMARSGSLYTEATMNALKKAMKEADKVYHDKNAGYEDVNGQAYELSVAMMNLEARPKDSQGGSGSGDSSGYGGGGNAGKLDIRNLADGVYSVTGSMIKIDKQTASMSNEAINHTVKLTVKGGKYYITMDFKGLTINNSLGYLSKLRYFKSGYTLDQYGAPQGSLEEATVESYQQNSDGSLVEDSFGTNYPHAVTFELIPEALTDGYVPLQVFVPIMDAISPGVGTQPVFLKIDWSSIKATTQGDESFNNDNTSGHANSPEGNSANGAPVNNNTASTLPVTTVKPTALAAVKTAPAGKLGSGITPAAGKTASLKSKGKSNLSSAGGLGGGPSKLSTAAGLGKNSGTTPASGAADSNGTHKDGTNSQTTQGAKKAASKAVVPSIISLLALLAGFGYKVKSRRWLGK